MQKRPVLLLATTNKDKRIEFEAALKSILEETPLSLKTFLDYSHVMPEIEETRTTFLANATLKAKQTLTYFISNRLEPDLWGVLSDDSGLMVPELNNAPGVYSARYAGVNVSDTANREKLLTQLKDVKIASKRTAQFITCLVLIYYASKEAWYEMNPDLNSYNEVLEEKRLTAKPNETSKSFEDATFSSAAAMSSSLATLSVTGTRAGWIALEERGNQGFGYDKVFIPNIAAHPNKADTTEHGEYLHRKTFAEMSLEAKNSCSHRTDALTKLKIPLQSVVSQIFGHNFYNNLDKIE
ncbi:XTP/dITP diphosphohydrolase [Spirochaetota bacterium]|nr:XTP/dITP diphosphohydrolase [Spirochaetota bacterium]